MNITEYRIYDGVRLQMYREVYTNNYYRHYATTEEPCRVDYNLSFRLILQL
jgi:hypothetical protein